MTASRWRICSATTKSTTRPIGEDNRDGASENHSNNCGHEGPTDDPAITALRRQLRKNQLACLLLAQGVPLVLAGDEVGNSQSGNNNAYCQDNEIGWVNWDGLNREGDDLTDFIGQMTETTKALSAAPFAPLARWTARRWILRRVVADAGGRRDEGAGLEFSGRPVSRLRARTDRARASRRFSSCSMPPPRRSRSNCRNCRNTRAGSNY